jgi:protein ImuB
VDTATFAGRRLAEELHGLLREHSAMCGRLQITARTDTGEELARTWRTDLGGLGGLTAARITDRVRWQLEGWLTAGALAERRQARGGRGGAGRAVPVRAALVHLAIAAQEIAPAGAEQERLWGGPSGGDRRAHRALDRVQGLIGGAGVLTAAVQGGRDVRDQVYLRPWGEQATPPRSVDRPWPGRLPAPAPATVLMEPEPVDLRDATGAPVRLDARFALSAPPATLGRCGPEDDRVRAVVGWAGPWPLVERWWTDEPRRRTHLQVALEDGSALLLAYGAETWTCEAAYD